MNYYLGIDFGTSGARAIAIDSQRQTVFELKQSFSSAKHSSVWYWEQALESLLQQISSKIKSRLDAIAINGTSSTVLLTDESGKILGEPIMYNDDRGKESLLEISRFAPQSSIVLSATSSLAKLLWFQQQSYFKRAKYFLHQADWLGFLLHGKLGISDYHNTLKLGYDVQQLSYPHWLQNRSFSPLLPRILPPGTIVGMVSSQACDRFSLPRNCVVCAGTTDSIAAFIAAGATQPGEAVTSLGSTLVLKLLSTHPITATQYGIYSHRFGSLWLAGGASNTGGAVLKQFFSNEELTSLSKQIDPTRVSKLNYYPLITPGERFPVNDPNLLPRLEPCPQNRAEFLHELLSAIARIEAQGYRKLQELGANSFTSVISAGGGANNPIWQQIRQQHLSVPVTKADNAEAAYGTAILAMKGANS